MPVYCVSTRGKSFTEANCDCISVFCYFDVFDCGGLLGIQEQRATFCKSLTIKQQIEVNKKTSNNELQSESERKISPCAFKGIVI